MTLGERLTATGGKPSGFDYMRISLALLIICYHTVVTSYGDAVQVHLAKSLWGIPFVLSVPMFFSLSGFLVAGSLERCKTIVGFLGLRALRILPALTGEILLSALILGPLLTTVPLQTYFSDHQFKVYFLNIIGDIHYELPGLFGQNPNPFVVNGQLWTIPFELICYVVLTALAVTGVFRRRVLLGWLMVVLYGTALYRTMMMHDASRETVHAQALVVTFLAGVLIYQYRDKLEWSGRLFILAAVLVLALVSFPNGHRFIPLPVAYATIYLGLLNPRRNRLISSGDYSYGLYLYGYPLQQAFASLGPAVHHWYLNLIAVIPAASVIACLSWWGIEKPALGLRHRLKQLEERYVNAKGSVASWVRQSKNRLRSRWP